VDSATATAQQLSPQGRIQVLLLDLASLASVQALAETVQTKLAAGALPPLQALVCNAGIQFAEGLHHTADGFEQTFGVNHLGHFLLVELLLPHLNATGRVVVVSSGTHFDAPRVWTSAFFGMPGPQYLEATALARGAVPAGMDPTSIKANQFRYTTSKLCNLLFTYELNRRLRAAHSAITVNAFDPGLMPGTGLARATSKAALWAWNHVLPVLRLFPGVNAPATSGRYLARLSADPALNGRTDGYYEADQCIPSSNLSRRPELWAALWADSESLVGVRLLQR
jgi:NAD(P)-dependent dehydrogenase (short-subunit alcohol dehydrogenase family)